MLFVVLVWVSIVDKSLNSRKTTRTTTKVQPVTMIANSAMNETGKTVSLPFLVCPPSFLKNQLSPSPCHFLEILLVLQKSGKGIENYVNL